MNKMFFHWTITPNGAVGSSPFGGSRPQQIDPGDKEDNKDGRANTTNIAGQKQELLSRTPRERQPSLSPFKAKTKDAIDYDSFFGHSPAAAAASSKEPAKKRSQGNASRLARLTVCDSFTSSWDLPDDDDDISSSCGAGSSVSSTLAQAVAKLERERAIRLSRIGHTASADTVDFPNAFGDRGGSGNERKELEHTSRSAEVSGNGTEAKKANLMIKSPGQHEFSNDLDKPTLSSFNAGVLPKHEVDAQSVKMSAPPSVTRAEDSGAKNVKKMTPGEQMLSIARDKAKAASPAKPSGHGDGAKVEEKMSPGDQMYKYARSKVDESEKERAGRDQQGGGGRGGRRKKLHNKRRKKRRSGGRDSHGGGGAGRGVSHPAFEHQSSAHSGKPSRQSHGVHPGHDYSRNSVPFSSPRPNAGDSYAQGHQHPLQTQYDHRYARDGHPGRGYSGPLYAQGHPQQTQQTQYDHRFAQAGHPGRGYSHASPVPSHLRSTGQPFAGSMPHARHGQSTGHVGDQPHAGRYQHHQGPYSDAHGYPASAVSHGGDTAHAHVAGHPDGPGYSPPAPPPAPSHTQKIPCTGGQPTERPERDGPVDSKIAEAESTPHAGNVGGGTPPGFSEQDRSRNTRAELDSDMPESGFQWGRRTMKRVQSIWQRTTPDSKTPLQAHAGQVKACDSPPSVDAISLPKSLLEDPVATISRWGSLWEDPGIPSFIFMTQQESVLSDLTCSDDFGENEFPHPLPPLVVSVLNHLDSDEEDSSDSVLTSSLASVRFVAPPINNPIQESCSVLNNMASICLGTSKADNAINESFYQDECPSDYSPVTVGDDDCF